MLIKFTDEQLLIRDMVRVYTEKELAPRDKWMDEHGFDPQVHKRLSELGIIGAGIPAEYGGGGCDGYTCAMIVHELGKGSASIAMALDINWVATDIIEQYGTEAQKQLYLTEAAKGTLFCFGLTESGAGSDAGGLRTRAVRRADGCWVVNGNKAWITNAGTAEYYVIMAKTERGAPGGRGISSFIVKKGTPGFTIGVHEDKMGMRGSETAELYFDNMVLPPDSLVGAEGRGFNQAMWALDGGRVYIAAICLGMSERAMGLAAEYAKNRKAFGKAICEHEAIQFKFADMRSQISAMTLMMYEAAAMRAAGVKHTSEAAQAKLFNSECCTKICLDCLQIFGGHGYSKEYDIERLVRDAKLLEIGEGTSEILRMVIGRAALASC